jgi:hypothetical protein
MPTAAPSTSRDANGAADPDVSWRTVALYCVPLGLIALVIHEFSIESPAFFTLSLVVWGGFAIHALLPRRFRLPFLVALTVAAATIVFGPIGAAWLAGPILLLVLLSRARWVGLAGILAIAGALLYVRITPKGPASLQMVLPILASMLMFRLFLLLRMPRAPLAESFAYLFLLPNLCFTLFPVVDFKTFRRGYYSDRAERIYAVGIRWITLGIVHLLLYRLVYYRLAIAPSHIASRWDALRYILSSYLLYLRISGDFHICIGILHLFGFNLPASHDRYFLASSFTDFYRRINVYWRDFILAVFYVPVFLRLRRAGGATLAIVGATTVAFVASWLLHAYQWFWLRGTFVIEAKDALFWGIFGTLVMASALVEDRFGRERHLVKPKWTLARIVRKSAATAFTFATICFLWSMWTSESFAEWRFIVGRAFAR